MPLKLAFDTKIKSPIQIDIVEENKNIILLYRKSLKNIKFPPNIKIKFNDKISFKKKYDILHLSDSFQYIDNWKQFLKKTMSCAKDYIIFNNLPAGEIPTFNSMQKFYKFNIGYRFFNILDFVNEFKSFELVYKSKFLNKINNKYEKYPQDNLKKNLRIGYPCTLIFKKK